MFIATFLTILLNFTQSPIIALLIVIVTTQILLNLLITVPGIKIYMKYYYKPKPSPQYTYTPTYIPMNTFNDFHTSSFDNETKEETSKPKPISSTSSWTITKKRKITCTTCGGRGNYSEPSYINCSGCCGSGRIGDMRCFNCGGQRRVMGTKNVHCYNCGGRGETEW